jgi:hypothetical protein
MLHRSGSIRASNDPDPHFNIHSSSKRAGPNRIPKMAEMVSFHHQSGQRLLASARSFITAVQFLVSNGINRVDSDSLVGDSSS